MTLVFAGKGRVINISLRWYWGHSNVRCLAERPPPPSNCVETLDKMDKKETLTTFTTNWTIHPGGIEVPEMIIDCECRTHALIPTTSTNRSNTPARHNCMLMIEPMQDGPVRGSYQQIWRAAVAVDAMCVRRGLAGWAVGVGSEVRKFSLSTLRSSRTCGSQYQSQMKAGSSWWSLRMDTIDLRILITCSACP